MALNLNQLRIFRAVSETNSITAAAQALKISQPAVSKQLAELEKSIGVALFDRRPRGVRLTAAGEVLSHHARRLFREEEAAEAAVRALLGLDAGRLAIGASTTIGNYIVPPLFGELRDAHPHVALQLEIGNTARIQHALSEGGLDLGLTEGFVTSEGLHVEVFARDEMVLIVSPEHALARGTSGLDDEQVARLPLIMRERGSGTREVVEDALARRGIQIEPVMTLGSTEAIKSAVMSGLGAAFVSRLTLQLELESGHLVALEVHGPSIRRELHVLSSEGKQPSPAAREFLRLLRKRYPR